MNDSTPSQMILKQLVHQQNDASVFSEELISYLKNEKLFSLWVPKAFNGLEASLSDGLKILYDLAKLDGSLGWTVTLCAGASYFVGNMSAKSRAQIFTDQLPILGGSGGKWGTATFKNGIYILNGTWKYATGAEYLSHFTLNAVLFENGQPILDENGDEKFLSFVVPKEAVTTISDWDRMGMKATTTNSFYISDYLVDETSTFKYNQFDLPQLIFKIPFRVFADLTLWVNYAGMFAHFVNEIILLKGKTKAQNLLDYQLLIENQFNVFLDKVNKELHEIENVTEELSENIHQFCSDSVKKMSQEIIGIWPYLGTRAASDKEVLNLIFRDFFTATQHHNFLD